MRYCFIIDTPYQLFCVLNIVYDLKNSKSRDNDIYDLYIGTNFNQSDKILENVRNEKIFDNVYRFSCNLGKVKAGDFLRYFFKLVMVSRNERKLLDNIAKAYSRKTMAKFLVIKRFMSVEQMAFGKGYDLDSPYEKIFPSNKILVAYFSWSGTSQKQAEAVAAQTGGELYRIERETPYSTDYNTVAYGEAKDEADANARPPLKNPLSSVSDYNKIVLCYPIWWHTAPMVVGTFLERYDWSGKTIYPISQSASMSTSQYEESLTFIKGCAKNAAVDAGLFSRNDSDVTAYVSGTVLGN